MWLLQRFDMRVVFSVPLGILLGGKIFSFDLERIWIGKKPDHDVEKLNSRSIARLISLLVPNMY